MIGGLSANSRAILLLTAPLLTEGLREPTEILSWAEYRDLARHLVKMGSCPADLFDQKAIQELSQSWHHLDSNRVHRLLGREVVLEKVMERWSSRNIWVVTRADKNYSRRLKKLILYDCPPVLYGCGERSIMDLAGLAVIGSRTTSVDAGRYSEALGRLAAAAGVSIVCGGDDATDQMALRGALSASGKAIAVGFRNMEHMVGGRGIRSFLTGGQLVLISPNDPLLSLSDHGQWHAAYSPTECSRLIYALADAALVVNSAKSQQGIGWEGACEQLDRLRYVPVYIQLRGDDSSEQDSLLSRGARPWPDPKTKADLMAIIQNRQSVVSPKLASHYNSVRALELLRRGTGIHDATFRPDQEEAIQHVVEGRGRLIVVQATGWGKSFVYFIAIRLLRESGSGPALLISPLLSLMRNQIKAANAMGVCAERLSSDNKDQWSEVEKKLDRDQVDILLITPEGFNNRYFRSEILPRIDERTSMLVIDECHCISDWGHDFRPKYRQIDQIARALPPNIRLLGTTATANDRVAEDLHQVLGPGLTIKRGPLVRPSITLQTVRLRQQSQRLAWLAQVLPRLPGFGIIYTLTVRDTEIVADWLRSRKLNVKPYTSRVDPVKRERLESELLKNQVKALVATVALGMGFDKPDVSFVIHYQAPGSVTAYYQQVGRAGRALETARGILLSGDEETDITDHFIENAFPTPEEAQLVIEALKSELQGLTVPQLLRTVNLTKKRIEKTLDLLSLETPAPIVKQGSKWQLGLDDVQDSFWERTQRLTDLRRQEQAQMQEYVELESGHMEFLIRALGGKDEGLCPPLLPPISDAVNPQIEDEARSYLRNLRLPIKPRRSWPIRGVMEVYSVYGKIPKNRQAKPGRALSLWSDGGWGQMVRAGKQQDKSFSIELVDACISLIDRWKPSPTPMWVTCIPSLGNPHLVVDFAKRLAEALGLPFHAVIEQIRERPAQKTMDNSEHQARNLDGTLKISSQQWADTFEEPVLLVDDIVDSGWTFTVAAWLLREHGSGPVWPLALSMLRYD